MIKNKNLNILIVEDEFFASKYLSEVLKNLGFNFIFKATNAHVALNIVKNNIIDLVFIDINISGSIDGIQCSILINKEYFVPIIYTTAYCDSLTIEQAANTNLFSYLIKPFEPHDVEAALQIALKALSLKSTQSEYKTRNKDLILNLGDNQTYNIKSKTFYIANISIDLTKKELDVLDIFCNNLNQNISYETLKEKVWNDTNVSNSTVRDTISRLKRKAPNILLENIVNYGYILKLLA